MRSNWIKTIEKILNTLNLVEYTDSPIFNVISKKMGKQFYKSKWEERICTSDYSRLAFYKQIKSDLSPSKYTFLPFYQRKRIAKLRCSSHLLEIEKGRHKKKNVGDRLCQMCPMNAVEDENHFLTNCTAYTSLRRRHGYTGKNSIEIMNDADQNNLSIYLSRSFDIRKNKLDPPTTENCVYPQISL